MHKDRKFLRSVLGLPFVPPGRMTKAATRGRSGLLRAHRGAAPPPVRVLEGLFGLFDNRVLGMLVELNIPDLLDDPMSAEELAHAIGRDTEPLRRLLDYAVAKGFLGRDRQGRYRNNAVSEILRKDNPNSWRGWVQFATSEWFWDAWRHADSSILPNGDGAMRAATGYDFFEYTGSVNQDAGTTFNAAMEAGAVLQAIALTHGLPWRRISSVCDVGGGTGAAVEFLLNSFPHLRATLFDLPQVVANARPALTGDLSERCTIVGGDFFTSVPEGLERYLMLAIVHDWNDDEAARILQNVARSLGKHGRVVVIENVLSEVPRDDFVRASDLLMLVVGSGRERTREQFETLFSRSRLKLTKSSILGSGFTAFELASA